jgi:hypothetical protein
MCHEWRKEAFLTSVVRFLLYDFLLLERGRTHQCTYSFWEKKRRVEVDLDYPHNNEEV